LLNLSYEDKFPQLLSKARELTEDHKQILGLEDAPTLRTPKTLWLSFEQTNEINRVEKTAGRKKKDVRRGVEFSSSTELSIRDNSQN